MSVEEKLDLVLRAVADLALIVASHHAKPAHPGVTLAEAMALTGHKSPTVFYRFARRLKIHPYSRGRYRRNDILDGMARAALPYRKPAKQRKAA